MRLYHGTSVEFDEFNLAFTCDMGFHFGSAEQARKRLEDVTSHSDRWIILSCDVEVTKPINLPDVGDWSDHQVVSQAILDTQNDEELMVIARRYLDKPYSFFGEQPHERMKAEIESLGYDSIIYHNVGEGVGGESYLIFQPAKIKIVG